MQPARDRIQTDSLSVPTASNGEAWQTALDSGLDMSLVELSLRKTPWERLVEHDDALAFAARLRAATQHLNGKT